jgi:capsular polysaccharide transport system permease protein
MSFVQAALRAPQKIKPARFRMVRVVIALIFRETGSRGSRASLGFLWNIVEPVISIAILSVLFSMITRVPRLGTNFPLYYVTGMVPFRLYTAISGKLGGAMRFSSNLLGFPSVTVIDVIAARLLLAVLIHLCVFIVMLILLNAYFDLHLRPDMVALLAGLGMAMALGLGIGTLNSVLFPAFPIYETVWGIMRAPQVLMSGVMFHIDDLPEPIFAVLKWNPVAQVVAQVRHAFYPSYEIAWVSPAYVLLISAICFALGLVGLYRYIFDVLDT